MLTTAQETRSSLFYGWVIVGATFVLLMIMSGITYSTPVLFRFFEADFAIGRAQAAFLFSCSQLLAFLAGPFAGGLVERAGPRVVVGGGLTVMAAGLVGASAAGSYVPLAICYGIVGLGSGSVYIPLLGLIQRWFYQRRGSATGIATTGVGIGTLALPLVAASVADQFGWRVLCVVFAALCTTIGLLAASFLVADPKLKGLAPDGAADGAAASVDQSVTGLTFGEVLRDRQFYLIYVSSFGAAVLSFMAFVHLPQQLSESGGGRLQAATIISVIGLFSLAARLGGGAWADRVGRVRMIRVALMIMQATSVLWAVNIWGNGVLFGVAALFGITYGLCIALLPSVIADSFGNRQISKIIGVIYTSFALAAFVGPTVAGLLHDRYGDYGPALMACAVLSALALAASFGITRRY
jgi:MFS transporter, OFA family, oxalate/formate antiporter